MNSHLKIATNFTHLLENQFQIGKFKFGLDPILGIIPVLGDMSDFVFKSNTKNLKILHDFAPTEFYEGEFT